MPVDNDIIAHFLPPWCRYLGPASNGGAMDLWLLAQSQEKPYFSSYTES